MPYDMLMFYSVFAYFLYPWYTSFKIKVSETFTLLLRCFRYFKLPTLNLVYVFLQNFNIWNSRKKKRWLNKFARSGIWIHVKEYTLSLHRTDFHMFWLGIISSISCWCWPNYRSFTHILWNCSGWRKCNAIQFVRISDTINYTAVYLHFNLTIFYDE